MNPNTDQQFPQQTNKKLATIFNNNTNNKTQSSASCLDLTSDDDRLDHHQHHQPQFKADLHEDTEDEPEDDHENRPRLQGCPQALGEHQPAQQCLESHTHRDYDEVKQVNLFGISIVALTINGKERLCLAQISNTLLKEFSYNEIHNRRVALGITCVQCTPIQLEMLRRAGAMPSSSRRCGMITMREAERLCRSFLVEEQPPELPENFYFTVAHRINYGCKGRFIPARYISSRAKCIECFFCGEFYSPNKFIFHSHRQPHSTDCNPPDSPNINSWRKHIDLDLTQEQSQAIKYAWEDVKSLFNGGTRRRAANGSSSSAAPPTGPTLPGRSGEPSEQANRLSRTDDEQLIDVERDEPTADSIKSIVDNSQTQAAQPMQQNNRPSSNKLSSIQPYSTPARASHSLMLASPTTTKPTGPLKRLNQEASSHNQTTNKRFSLMSHHHDHQHQLAHHKPVAAERPFLAGPNCSIGSVILDGRPTKPNSQSVTYVDFSNSKRHHQPAGNPSDLNYPMSNFIYSQLYTQLMQQPQQTSQQPQQQLTPSLDPQLALRHHLWSSLLANLQSNTSSQTLALQQDNLLARCSQPMNEPESMPVNNLSHLISTQLYSPHQNLTSSKLQRPNSSLIDPYKTTNQSSAFPLHKFSSDGADNMN